MKDAGGGESPNSMAPWKILEEFKPDTKMENGFAFLVNTWNIKIYIGLSIHCVFKFLVRRKVRHGRIIYDVCRFFKVTPFLAVLSNLFQGV